MFVVENVAREKVSFAEKCQEENMHCHCQFKNRGILTWNAKSH